MTIVNFMLCTNTVNKKAPVKRGFLVARGTLELAAAVQCCQQIQQMDKDIEDAEVQ